MFSVVISILKESKLISLLSAIIVTSLKIFNVPNVISDAIIISFLEITNGISYLSCIHFKSMSTIIAITAFFYAKARKEAFEAARKEDEARKNQKEEAVKFVLTMKVDGMMCEKCASRVNDALSGFGEININLEEKAVTILSEELVDADEIKKIITELGYTPKEIED